LPWKDSATQAVRPSPRLSWVSVLLRLFSSSIIVDHVQCVQCLVDPAK
jgi:hypothetical protein